MGAFGKGIQKPKLRGGDMANASSESQVFFVGFWPDYEAYFLNAANQGACNYTLVNPKDNLKHLSGFRWLPRAIQNAFFARIIKKIFQKYPNALFIFQGDTTLLTLLSKQKDLPKVAVLMRNIISAESQPALLLNELSKRSVPIFSFDQQNCKQFNFSHYQQFAEKLSLAEQKVDYDLCFIGRGKGRQALLKTIKHESEKLGFRTNIEILGVKKVQTKTGVKPKRILDYQEYLKRQLNCHCIIDINQSEQLGLTLRPIEAMLYEKKLLTNNESIRHEAFYRPDNIFIISEDMDYHDVKSFMAKPYIKIPSEVMEQYQAAPVISDIIQQIELSYNS